MPSPLPLLPRSDEGAPRPPAISIVVNSPQNAISQGSKTSAIRRTSVHRNARIREDEFLGPFRRRCACTLRKGSRRRAESCYATDGTIAIHRRLRRRNPRLSDTEYALTSVSFLFANFKITFKMPVFGFKLVSSLFPIPDFFSSVSIFCSTNCRYCSISHFFELFRDISYLLLPKEKRDTHWRS